MSFLSTMRTLPKAPRPTTRSRRKWLRFTVGQAVVSRCVWDSIRHDVVEDGTGDGEDEAEEEGRGGRTLAVEINGLALTVAHCSQRDLEVAVRLQGAGWGGLDRATGREGLIEWDGKETRGGAGFGKQPRTRREEEAAAWAFVGLFRRFTSGGKVRKEQRKDAHSTFRPPFALLRSR